MSATHVISESLAQAHLLPAQDIPNPGPKIPPGAQAIQDVVGYVI